MRKETHLVGNNKEAAVGQDGPDENVAKDPGDQVVRVVDHHGAVPVEGDEGPGQGPRDDGGVDEARRCVVAEVQGRQIEEVDDEHDLGPDEVRADKEHDEGKVEEVVDDEVAADAGGVVNGFGGAREEVRDVAELEDEEDDPGGALETGRRHTVGGTNQ